MSGIFGLATMLPAVFAEDSTSSWQWCGWGGGGYFWACTSSPVDDNVFYLGGDVAGAYKSSDHGESWKFINNGISNYGVFSLAIAPSEPQTVFAMTLDGINKSTDGGESWQVLQETTRKRLHISALRHKSVRGIAVSPVNPNVVFAGTGAGALYKSVNGGEKWTRLLYSGGATNSKTMSSMLNGDLVIMSDFEKPGNVNGWKANTKYASKLAHATSQSSEVACSGKGSLAIDVNAPEPSWSATGRVQTYFGSKDLSAYKKISARLYLPLASPKMQVQFAVQSGTEWAWQDDKFIDAKPGEWNEFSLDLTKIKHPKDIKLVYVIVKSPFSAFCGKVYLDSVLLHRTADAGVDPRLLTTPAGESPIHAVCISDKNPDLVYVTTADALYLSRDNGKSWGKLNTPSAPLFALPSPTDENTVYAAFKDHKFMKSTDLGSTWNMASNGIPDNYVIREIAVDHLNPARIWCIASKGWASIILSTVNGGKDWKVNSKYKLDLAANPTLPHEHKNGMRDLSKTNNITVSKVNPDNIFVAANWSNVFSSDGGKTWIESSRGTDISCIQDICFHNGKVYAVVMDEGLLVSSDNGSNWQQLIPLKYNEKLSGHQWRVHVNGPSGQERILSSFSSWNKSPNRIMRSIDGGKTFKFAKGLPESVSSKNTMWERSFPKAMAVDPKSPDTVYLGMDGDPTGGVFKSTDGGETWERLPNQPGSLKVFHGLAVDPTDSKRIYWAASGNNGGAYVSNDGGNSWQLCFKEETTLFNLTVASDGTVFCSGSHLWASHDHGKTWAKVYDNKMGNTIQSIEVDPDNSSRVWISIGFWSETSIGGVFRTDNGGKSWVDISGDIPYRRPSVLKYNPETRELWACGVGAFKIKQ